MRKYNRSHVKRYRYQEPKVLQEDALTRILSGYLCTLWNALHVDSKCAVMNGDGGIFAAASKQC